LWQGVDVADPERLRLVWINKLPFAPFADPVIAARRAHAVEAARLEGEADPERVGDEAYYLPLAALGLRQAVGRLIRSTEHRGVIVIGDAKLAGFDARRRMYRRVFLGSLDPGLRIDGLAGDIGAGNVMSMRDAWHTIIAFGAEQGFVDPANAETALSEDAIDALIDLPETRSWRGLKPWRGSWAAPTWSCVMSNGRLSRRWPKVAICWRCCPPASARATATSYRASSCRV
jgi:ATP-dependent DNA helicase RecQ